MKRPERDADVSAEERAAVLLLVAHLHAEHRDRAMTTVTDDDLEAAHHAVIEVNRIEGRLMVDAVWRSS